MGDASSRDAVAGSMFSDPFRGFDSLTGRPFEAPEAWRADLGRFLSDTGRDLVRRGLEHAARRGAADLDVVDLLGAAAAEDPARALLRAAGAEPDALLARIGDLADGEPGDPPVTLTPAAKRALLDAQRVSRALEAGYLGPEHLLLGVAAGTDTAAVRLLTAQGVTANEIQNALLARPSLGGPGRGRGAGPSRTPVLDSCGRDVTAEARTGALDPVVGREEVIAETVEILARRTRNNPCLIGEPGVGKTSVLEGVAQRIVDGAVPEPLKDLRVLALDLARIAAGSRAETADRVARMLEEIRGSAGELVVFVDGVEVLAGSGDAASLLMPALADGDVHVVAAGTTAEFRRAVGRNAALDRRFQPVLVAEPTPDGTVEILAGLRDKYEAHHQVKIADTALDAAARLSARHVHGRFQPDKAVDVLDRAAARVRLRALSPRDDVRELEQRLGALHRDKEQAVADEDFPRAERLRVEIEELRPQLDRARRGRPRDWREHDDDGAVSEGAPEVTAADIAEVVAQMTGISVDRLTEEERGRLIRLEEHIGERIVGQEQAVAAIGETVRRARAGLADPDRPLGSFVFVGPPGVGKTESARALADVLFGGSGRLTLIDLAEYGEAFTVGRLIGRPPGYVGYEEEGQLTEAVRRRPHGVVVLDAIERAHPAVREVVLRMLDEGRVTDGQGRTIDFGTTIIVLTTGVGGQRVLEAGRDSPDLRHEVLDLLVAELGSELIDRVDETIVFARLDHPQLRAVVDLFVRGTQDRLAGQGVGLEVTVAARDLLAEHGHRPGAGARPLRGTVRRELDGPLARMLLGGDLTEGDTVHVDRTGDDVAISVTPAGS
ncbi:ATP-dependent Clp protease ATP-binding subunit ClpC [Actinomadura rubteroloni]|uniref:ATP-dependent Clp protease ATP-binding subunit ClpC n=1 Tax=Actinomadura rubteroloni TaxID=1926885 RepID=A0A2P4UFQ5_9ACTN|nr:ATP-dependent Clp protease ATP-binding subunit [Actinomadura rubteroloni]POM23872.1 ATP-dependent Clp protease ATP-binding subunit ClpC [Actinomadura rubteroloni]